MNSRIARIALLLVTLCVPLLISLAASGGTALADPPTSPPGQGECDGGNSDHDDCVEDPSDNGKDCEEHGQQGGINENHCPSDEETDVCPDLDGVQTDPADCEEGSTDACPEIDGDQPEGTDCDPDTDVCPDIDGVQTDPGDCEEGSTDACPEIDGDQAEGTDCDGDDVGGEVIDTDDPTTTGGGKAGPKAVAAEQASPRGDLPFTGVELPFVGLFGLLLMGAGVIMHRDAQRRSA